MDEGHNLINGQHIDGIQLYRLSVAVLHGNHFRRLKESI